MHTPRARPWRPGGAIGVVAGVALLCVFAPPTAAAQPCDPTLPLNSAQPNGYRPRGDRCEGVYKRPVSSFGVQLISLTAASSIGPALCVPGQPVYMVWPAGSGEGAPVRLQVESYRPQLYYRLDTERPRGAMAFAWPSDPRCNNEVRLSISDLGILARTPYVLAGKTQPVLLPVGLTGDPATRVASPYRAVLMPGRRVREVYVSLWRYGVRDEAIRLVSERPLGMRPYPPGSPIAVPLAGTDLPIEGVYRARLSVEFESGVNEAIEFHFVHGR